MLGNIHPSAPLELYLGDSTPLYPHLEIHFFLERQNKAGFNAGLQSKKTAILSLLNLMQWTASYAYSILARGE